MKSGRGKQRVAKRNRRPNYRKKRENIVSGKIIGGKAVGDVVTKKKKSAAATRRTLWAPPYLFQFPSKEKLKKLTCSKGRLGAWDGSSCGEKEI